MSLHHSRLEELEIENERLRWRVRELEGDKCGIPLGYGLTKTEKRVMVSLLTARSGIATHEHLMTEVYGDEWMSRNVLLVYICKLRKKVHPFGIEIETSWGQGYRITAEMRAKVAQHLADESPRENV